MGLLSATPKELPKNEERIDSDCEMLGRLLRMRQLAKYMVPERPYLERKRELEKEIEDAIAYVIGHCA